MTPNNSEKRSEVDVLTSPGYGVPSQITDLEGNTYKVKKISLKKEAEIGRLLKDVFAKSISAEPEKAVELLSDMPELYGKAAAVILEMSYEDVISKFDLETLKELVDPFLSKFLGLVTKTPVLKDLESTTPLQPLDTTSDGNQKPH